MPALALAHSRRLAALLPSLLVIVLCSPIAHAGGPKYVAGTSFFNPAALGQPIHWNAGQVNYYVDRGPLNGSVSNLQATAMVDAAAALWSAIMRASMLLQGRLPAAWRRGPITSTRLTSRLT